MEPVVAVLVAAWLLANGFATRLVLRDPDLVDAHHVGRSIRSVSDD